MRQIPNLNGYFINEKAEIFSNNKFKKLTKLKIRPHKDGYWQIKLRHNNKDKMFLVHRLLAITFIPNLENKPQINHINGIRSDLSLENLEWVTPSENMYHAFKIGRKSSLGEKNSKARFSESDILNIRKSNLSIHQLSKKYSASYSTINNILKKRSWKHL